MLGKLRIEVSTLSQLLLADVEDEEERFRAEKLEPTQPPPAIVVQAQGPQRDFGFELRLEL